MFIHIPALAQGKSHVLTDRQRVEQGPVLEDDSHLLANLLHLLLRIVGDVLASDNDPARVRLKKPHDVLQCDRLAHTAASQDAHRFSRQNIEANVLQDVMVAEGFGNVLKVDVRCGLWVGRHS